MAAVDDHKVDMESARKQLQAARKQYGSALKLGVSQTAVWVAYFRILEAERKDAVFVDHMCEKMLGREGPKAAWQRMTETIGSAPCIPPERMAEIEYCAFIVRHRFMDDHILRSLYKQTQLALQQTGAPPKKMQVVDLAAGFDARAFRMPFPANTHFYEVDRGEVIALKNSRVPAGTPVTCASRICVEADLETDKWEDSLAMHGFDRDTPTVWVIEGLLLYLTEDEVRQLLKRVRAISAPGSSVCFDSYNPAVVKGAFARRQAILGEDGCPFNFLPLHPAEVLASCGWDNPKVRWLGEEGASFGRIFKADNFGYQGIYTAARTHMSMAAYYVPATVWACLVCTQKELQFRNLGTAGNIALPILLFFLLWCAVGYALEWVVNFGYGWGITRFHGRGEKPEYNHGPLERFARAAHLRLYPQSQLVEAYVTAK